jgi:hypothetical protein
MTRDRLVTAFVVLTAAAMAVVVWVFVLHPSQVVHDRPVLTTPIVEPGLTPLPRDSGPRNNRRGPSAPGNLHRSVGAVANPGPRRGSRPAGSDSTPASAPKPKTTHKRPAAPHKPNTGGQASQPPPAPSKPPPAAVGVTAPAPATVCLRPAVTVNC